MKNYLSDIADYLLLRGSHVHDIGLFHGKMGIVTALYLYADKNGDEVLQEYAWELFQQVYEGIHTDMPISLESGLAGIAYGTTLLRKRGLVDCSLNDILAEIDSKIMEHDPRRMTDMTIRTGMGGLALYLELRQTVEPIVTFDSQYLSEFQPRACRCGRGLSAPSLLQILDSPIFPVSDYVDNPVEIDGGSAYYLLNSAMA